MLKWYKEKPERLAQFLDSAATNRRMIAPKIQKQICKACAYVTTKAIIDDIGIESLWFFFMRHELHLLRNKWP
jgi:hypothetical protein